MANVSDSFDTEAFTFMIVGHDIDILFSHRNFTLVLDFSTLTFPKS